MPPWIALLSACLVAGGGNRSLTSQNLAAQAEVIASVASRAMKGIYCFAVFSESNDSLVILKHISKTSAFSVLIEYAPDKRLCRGLILLSQKISDVRFVLQRTSQILNTQQEKQKRKYTPAYLIIVLNDNWSPSQLQTNRGSRTLMGRGAEEPYAIVVSPPPRAWVADYFTRKYVTLAETDEVLKKIAFYRSHWPNLEGQDLRSLSLDSPPAMYEDGDGVESKIIEIIAKVLNANFRRKSISGISQWNKLTRALYMGLANVSGGLAIIESTSKFIDYGYPWETGCSSLLVPVPLISKEWNSLIKPFDLWIWLWTLMSLLAVTTALRILVKFQPHTGHPGNGYAVRSHVMLDNQQSKAAMDGYRSCDTSRNRGGIGCGLLEALGVLLVTANPAPFPGPRPVGRRFLLLIWSLAAILLITAYNSSLLSFLTAPYFDDPIDTIQEVVDHGMKWGSSISFNNDTMMFFLGHIVPSSQEILRKHFIHVPTQADLEARLSTRKYAVLGNRIDGKFCPLGLAPDRDSILKLRNIQDSLRCDFYALSYQRQSELRPWGDKVTMFLQQAGLLDYWLRDTLYRRVHPSIMSLKPSKEGYQPKIVSEAEVQALRVVNIAPVLALLALGLTAATAAFFVEVAPRALPSLAARMRSALARFRRWFPCNRNRRMVSGNFVFRSTQQIQHIGKAQEMRNISYPKQYPYFFEMK